MKNSVLPLSLINLLTQIFGCKIYSDYFEGAITLSISIPNYNGAIYVENKNLDERANGYLIESITSIIIKELSSPIEKELLYYQELLNANIHLKSVSDYLESNFKEQISLEGLSERFNLNKCYLCQLFKRHLGITLISYLNLIRLKYSMELLLNTDMPITTISYECGFGSQNYYSSIFKKYNSLSPLEYRKNYSKVLYSQGKSM